MPTLAGGAEEGGEFGFGRLRRHVADEYIATCFRRDSELRAHVAQNPWIHELACEISAAAFDDYGSESVAVLGRAMFLGYAVDYLSADERIDVVPVEDTLALFDGDRQLFVRWLGQTADTSMMRYPERLHIFEQWAAAVDRGSGKRVQAYLGYFGTLALMEIQRNVTAMDRQIARRLQYEYQREQEVFAAIMGDAASGLLDMANRHRLLRESFEVLLYRSVGSADMSVLRGKAARLAVVDALLHSMENEREGIAIDRYADDNKITYNSPRLYASGHRRVRRRR